MSTQEEVKWFLSKEEQEKFLDALDKTGELDFVGAAKAAKVDYYSQVLQELEVNVVFKTKVLAYIQCVRSQMINLMYRSATGKAKIKAINTGMCKQVITLIDDGEIFSGARVKEKTPPPPKPAGDVLASFKKELNLTGGEDGETDDDNF
jgi:hypothetical protein